MKSSKQLNPVRSATWLAGALLASATVLLPAHAAEKYPAGSGSSGGSGGMRHQQLDTDKDGRVSRAEAQRDAALRERFDVLDANRDGVLDAAELAAQDSQPTGRGTGVKQ